ncbi:Hypothetical protein R9X50_00025100 [Acrodontium crateriforme]|uniref:Cation/H+ exchanger transmembrane domain-containing protein n=1 Tax=Acrodontium crateriforme TaxID=150365 RepID=A0AAQ3M0B2_9PEZI|nr:Hypothetical protein R9X50_00025100 [Acrodontium crateriforme]
MTTIVESLTKVVTVTASTSSSTSRAVPQGGVIEHGNPSHYDPKNPIILFIIQAATGWYLEAFSQPLLFLTLVGIIIVFCRLLHYPLSLIRQPRVIAEVIGGILLGPSVMGRVPGFTAAIFPPASIPNLNLIANLGLVLFLFLVGLEVDLRYFVSNWRVALSVGTAGMAIPFGLGCAISWGLYHQFREDPGTVPISFGIFMLFIGVAMAITAFPVLCRILTELKLLSTPVGVIVLSAGVGNDVVGWILLALCVALVNAGSGLTALWVLLVCLGYSLFLAFAVRPGFLWLLRHTRSLQDGPSQGIIALTLLLALSSAFFTGVIGVHPIFGAFMVGLICPHEGGFAIKVTEKVEDLVSTLFLPLYFALSGLSTNLGLLDDGITWAYVVGVIAIAFCGKFAGGTLAARLNGLVWRESMAIGVLMSCKGLVELIVLNIGLQAKILSTRTFTIFVTMALITTFATTPLTTWLYPTWYQRKLEAWKRGEIDWETGLPFSDGVCSNDPTADQKLETSKVNTMLVYLRLDNMPTSLAFVSLMGSKQNTLTATSHPALEMSPQPERTGLLKSPIEVHGIRFMELTERNSTVMRVAEVDEYSFYDPVINAFRILGQLYNLAVSGEVRVVPENSFADTLIRCSTEQPTDLLLLPWSETGSMSESQTISTETVRQKIPSKSYMDFVSQTLNKAQTNTAVFISKDFSGTLKQRPSTLTRTMSGISLRSHRDNVTMTSRDRRHHIFLPFFGGRDGRFALRLALQLVENPDVTATIVHYVATAQAVEGGVHNMPSRESDAAFFAAMKASVPTDIQGRVRFDTVQTNAPVQEALAKASMEVAQNPKNGGDMVVLGRNLGDSDSTLPGDEDSSCLGIVASRLLDVRASLVVVQAKTSSEG